MDVKKDWQARVSEWMKDRFGSAPSLIEATVFPETSAYRPDLKDLRPTSEDSRRADFGPRFDQRDGAKGLGWLGPLQASHGIMTEYGTSGNGTDREQPAIVPTLSRNELKYLVTEPSLRMDPGPTTANATRQSILSKSDEWAAMRRAQGLSPFID